MLRIAVQSKGRLFEDTMNLLSEADIKVSASKRTLLVQSSNFPLEVLYLRDDDIPQSVASGVADIGVVGENEFIERGEDADIISRLGFSKCRLSLAIPKEINYQGVEWFNGKKIATSYPNILHRFMEQNGINAEIHVITGSVEISPGIGRADGIFDIVSSGSTLVSTQMLVANEQSLALHDHFHLAKVIGDKCRARRHNVEDAVCQTDARTDFHRTRNDVNLTVDALLLHELTQDIGIRGGYFLAVKPVYTTIVNLLGDGQRQAALRETKTADDICLLTTFYELVFTYHTNVGHARGYRLGNIVVAKVKHFQGEITGLHQQRAL